jgi:DNA-binding GntR family transcriptional regulator
VAAIDNLAPVDLGSTSLVALAVGQLRREIVGGTLVPGERLIEEQLTQRYGISRAPLREALRLLGQQGLVEHLPRRGVRVSTLSERDVQELYGLRDVLERYAVDVALPMGTEADLAPIRAALQEMRAAATAGDALELADAHQRFHLALLGLARHRQLTLAYEPVALKLQLSMAANMQREAERSHGWQDGIGRHERLLAAVESDHPQVLKDALATHGARSFLT